ncbi:MAG TPA: hypothetical protein VFV39_06715 [Limnobacter sp.]|nr:hypothetical protein [Limnobacter sp.]
MPITLSHLLKNSYQDGQSVAEQVQLRLDLNQASLPWVRLKMPNTQRSFVSNKRLVKKNECPRSYVGFATLNRQIGRAHSKFTAVLLQMTVESFFWSTAMHIRLPSAHNAASLGFAATVPTFLILALNGTSFFYGMDTVISLSIAVGLMTFAVAFLGKTLK